MKLYVVTAKMSVMLETTIEAENLDAAKELAKDIDGGEFAEIENSGEWDIIEVAQD